MVKDLTTRTHARTDGRTGAVVLATPSTSESQQFIAVALFNDVLGLGVFMNSASRFVGIFPSSPINRHEGHTAESAKGEARA